MRKMFRVIACIMVVFLMTAVLGACGSSTSNTAATTTSEVAAATTAATEAATTVATTPADTSPIKIGGLFVMSGPVAAVLDYQLPAVKMLISDVNKAGGINGRQIELILADDQGDPSLIAQKMNELKAAGCVAILGPFLDTCGPAAAKWAKDNQMPVLMAPTLSTKVSIDNFSKYSFTCGTSAWAIGRLLAKKAIADKVKTVYYIGPEGGVPQDIYDFFWKEIADQKSDIKNLGASRTGQNDTDFSNIISTCLSKKPDLVVDTSAGPPFAAFVQQAVRFNFFNKTKLAGFYLLDPSGTATFGKDYPEGIMTVDWNPFYSDDVKIKEFTTRYLAETKLYPGDITMTWWLAAKMAIEAFTAAKSTAADDIVAQLEALKVETPIGQVYFRPFDHQLIFPLYFGTSGYSDDFPIAVGKNIVKFDETVYPTEAELEAYKASLK